MKHLQNIKNKNTFLPKNFFTYDLVKNFNLNLSNPIHI